jgi:hypothetical protein
MSFVVFNGIGYKVGDLVVLRTDDMEGTVFSLFGDWTWKAKITSIFPCKILSAITHVSNP